MKKQTGEDVNISIRKKQLESIAYDVFGSVDAAKDWLSRPHPMLNGLTPNDYADNEAELERVRSMLAALKYGGVV